MNPRSRGISAILDVAIAMTLIVTESTRTEPTVKNIRGESEAVRIRQRVELDFVADFDRLLNVERSRCASAVVQVTECATSPVGVHANEVMRKYTNTLPPVLVDVNLTRNNMRLRAQLQH